jgi:hypothetical protein
VAAAATMKPLPRDENNPLAADTDHDDLILWLAYKEAKAMIKFEAVPPPKAGGKPKKAGARSTMSKVVYANERLRTWT